MGALSPIAYDSYALCRELALIRRPEEKVGESGSN